MKPRELVVYYFLFLNIVLIVCVYSIKMLYNHTTYDKEYTFILAFSSFFLILGLIPYFRSLVFESS